MSEDVPVVGTCAVEVTRPLRHFQSVLSVFLVSLFAFCLLFFVTRLALTAIAFSTAFALRRLAFALPFFCASFPFSFFSPRGAIVASSASAWDGAGGADAIPWTDKLQNGAAGKRGGEN